MKTWTIYTSQTGNNNNHKTQKHQGRMRINKETANKYIKAKDNKTWQGIHIHKRPEGINNVKQYTGIKETVIMKH